jgi:hypothetical protein
VPSASAPPGFTLEPKRTVPSQRQIEANRRNARLSTGPKTPEGKARAARNRSLHGLRSRNLLLPTEDPNEFAAPLTLPQCRRPRRRPVTPADFPFLMNLAGASPRIERRFVGNVLYGTLSIAGRNRVVNALLPQAAGF